MTPQQRLDELREWLAKGYIPNGQLANVEAVMRDLLEGRETAFHYQGGIAFQGIGLPRLEDGPFWREVR